MPKYDTRGNIIVLLLILFLIISLTGILVLYLLRRNPVPTHETARETKVSYETKLSDTFKISPIPTERTINYTKINGDFSEVWSLMPNGTVSMKFISSEQPSRYEAFKWSPNGKYLAFFADYSKNYHKGLYIYNSETNNVTLVESLLYQYHHAINNYAWSEDSNYFVYIPLDCSEALDVYSIKDEKRFELAIDSNYCVGGPIESISSRELVFIGYTPASSCSKDNSCKHSLYRLNLNNLNINELPGMVKQDIKITNYLYNPQERGLYMFTSDHKMLAYDLSTDTISFTEIDGLNSNKNYFGFVSLKSPDGSKTVFSAEIGMGETTNYLISFNPKIKAEPILTNTKASVQDWLSNTELLYIDSSTYETYVLNVLDMTSKPLLDNASNIFVRYPINRVLHEN